MIEMTLLVSEKETPNKLRWDADIDGVPFCMYIPKWRVPEPWPGCITAEIYESYSGERQALTPDRAHTDPSSRLTPIVAEVSYFKDHIDRIRYQPTMEPMEYWEIGEPYIPLTLTHGGANKLFIVVQWDKLSGEQFVGRRE